VNIEDKVRKMYEMALLFEGNTVEEILDIITSYIGRMLYKAGCNTETVTEICTNVALESMNMFTKFSLRKNEGSNDS
jgi:hypothetical protein